MCLVDAGTAFIRFVLYLRTDLPAIAAKRVQRARQYTPEPYSEGGAAWLVLVVKVVAFIVGGLYPFILLVASSGLMWTQIWAWSYVIALVVVAAITFLAKIGPELPEPPHGQPDGFEDFLNLIEQSLGYSAMLLQCFILTWADPQAGAIDPIVGRRWKFRGIRMLAHVLTILIHATMSFLHSKGTRRDRKAAFSVLGFLLFVLLIIFLSLNLRYTQVYFLWSIFVTAAAWFLFSESALKETLFLRARDRAGASHTEDWKNVVAFDFFCRVTSMSIFWYVKLYDPTGTSSKPGWAEFFG